MNKRCYDKYVTIISQLIVLVSHIPNLGICRPGTWELSLPQLGGVQFFLVTLAFLDVSSVPIEIFHISSKVHTISNKLV